MNKRPMKGYYAVFFAILAICLFSSVSFAGLFSGSTLQNTPKEEVSASETEKPVEAAPTPATVAEPAPPVPAAKEEKTKKEAVVVMPLITSGGIARDEVGSFESALIESLSSKYKVYSGKKVQDTVEKVYKQRSAEATAGKECDDTKCLQDIAMEFQTELIAVCSVKKMPGGGFMLSLKIQNVIEDTVPFSKAVPCENCNEFAAIRALQGMIAVQAAAPQAQAASPTPAPAPAKAAPSAIEGMVFVKQGDGGFYMDKTEVTQEAYQRVIGSNPSKFSGCPPCPVEQVSWNEAAAYCGKVGKRLPTEQEWEYAATSGGKGEIFAGTSDEGKLGEYAWYSDNSGGFFSKKTHPVGEKKPNGLGLYDMSGNVWEWMDGWYDDSNWKRRVFRGGAAADGVNFLRTASRLEDVAYMRPLIIGFRCAQ